MAIVVQKYGGSSVADAEKVKNVARRVAHAREEGNQVVVVVSAMGDTTDELLALAASLTTSPSRREMDLLLSTGEIVTSALLAMTLAEMGCSAISLTGAQAGIRTDAAHSRARITKVETQRIRRELDKGNVVVVAGFQGVSEEMDTTTLGRGGSDTTAVALAVGLGADLCRIYTDVEGIYTADPRLIPQARKLAEISYEEMLEMANYGARVMHSRAVELGQIYDMPIQVASSFTQTPGTLIQGEIPMEVKNKVRGIAHDMDLSKITVLGVPDKPGIAAAIFSGLAEAGVSVDTIVQNASTENITDLSFTVSKGDVAAAMRVIEPVCREVGAREWLSEDGLGMVSIVGSGMQNTPGYAAKMFQTLADAGINIQLITTSEIRISCIIDAAQVKDAVKALHRAFELETDS
ncbi:aspartate kinase [Chloroflexota bacterium]